MTGLVLGGILVLVSIIIYLVMHCCRNATHMMSSTDEKAKKRRRQRKLTEGDYFKGGGSSAFQDEMYLDDGQEEDYMTFSSAPSALSSPSDPRLQAHAPATGDGTDFDIHQPRSFMGTRPQNPAPALIGGVLYSANGYGATDDDEPDHHAAQHLVSPTQFDSDHVSPEDPFD